MIARRRFLQVSGGAVLAWAGVPRRASSAQGSLGLFLCGDVMTGRGIDQVLPHPSDPKLYEPCVASALEYVALAERAHGPIPRLVGFDYVWGEAVSELLAQSPDLRVINLETSVTRSDRPWPKSINYRMHPGNVPCLQAAGIDCCVLSNNHVLDWGVDGLQETLGALRGAGIAVAGAGRDAEEAGRPAVLDAGAKGRVLVFGLASPTAGVPAEWAAGETRPGVQLVPDLSPRTAARIVEQVSRWRRPGDRVVVSIHWGSNWGYAVPPEQRDFAHRLVDDGAADVVHGHSSHHPRGIEVHGGCLVLYGCGDFLNDYEGIGGREEFRSELVLAYFPTLEASGRLLRLVMTPFRVRRFRLQRATRSEAEWLAQALDRECRKLGTAVELTAEGRLMLTWT